MEIGLDLDGCRHCIEESLDQQYEFDYVVVGGGIAGVTCVEHISILDPGRSILLLTPSDVVKTVKNVEPLSKTLNLFDVEERPYQELSEYCPAVSVVKSLVVKLDTENQVVHTSYYYYHYKKLCICSGGVPKTIFDENPFVLSIRDTHSISHFSSRIENARRVVIVGNGGIASEIVYEFSGVEIIWVIKDKSINTIFMDAGAGEFLKGTLERAKDDNRSYIKRRKYTVGDSTGTLGACSVNDQEQGDCIGSALGPDWLRGFDTKGDKRRKVNIEREVEVKQLLNSCDGTTGNNFVLGEDDGLLVNDKMETSVKNVYAAGDVCCAGWDHAYHWLQMRLWTQARQMGSYAARCMWASLRNESIYMDFCFELFSHTTKFFGYKVILLGLYNGQKLDCKYEVLLRIIEGKEYIKCVMVNGRMQGAILIGETDLEETFENLILNQTDLSLYEENLLDPNIDIEDYFD